MQTRHLIQQAYYVPEQKRYYKSVHRHDFVTIDLGDTSVSIDGGDAYIRLVGDIDLIGTRVIEYHLYSDDSFETVADKFLWGTRGKGGKEPLKWVRLADCDLDHLRAIKETQWHIFGKIAEKVVDYWIQQKS